MIGTEDNKTAIIKRHFGGHAEEKVRQVVPGFFCRENEFVDFWCAVDLETNAVMCGSGQDVGKRKFCSFTDSSLIEPADFAICAPGASTSCRLPGEVDDFRIIELAVVDKKKGEKCFASTSVPMSNLRSVPGSRLVRAFPLGEGKHAPSVLAELKLKWLV